MRTTTSDGILKVRAIAGTYVVVLAWDLLAGKKSKLNGCLGFAIERTEFDASGNVVEAYWMRSIKRFKDKDKGLPPGTPVSTADHPIQTFQWVTTQRNPVELTSIGLCRPMELPSS